MGREKHDESSKAMMSYVPGSLIKDFDEVCKSLGKKRSEYLRELMQKEADQYKTSAEDYKPKVSLEALEEEEAKLAIKDKNYERQLGGEESNQWYGLCMLSKSFGLLKNFSNLDSVMLQLANYKFNGAENFSKSDLVVFRKKLLTMQEMDKVHKKIVEERTRRMNEFQNDTCEPQKNTEEALTNEDPEESLTDETP